MQELVEDKLVYENSSSKWACAILILPKAGLPKWRFTIDLRPINLFTVLYQFPIPRVEIEVTKTAGSFLYANFDLSRGYWQLPLYPNSQECQSFITVDNLYAPTRMLHGTTILHMQPFLTINFSDVLKPRTILDR